jgi:hypothetical protein
MAYMLSNCSGFNNDVYIPDGIQNMAYAFYNTSLNRDVHIPMTVKNLYNAFGASKFAANLYIDGTYDRGIYATDMMFGISRDLRKNVFFNSCFNSTFNNRYCYTSNPLEWTDMTDGNGFYNTQYNVYCYNNYAG